MGGGKKLPPNKVHEAYFRPCFMKTPPIAKNRRMLNDIQNYFSKYFCHIFMNFDNTGLTTSK